jgi:hypothetical protein
MASDNEIMKLRATVEDDATATIAKIQKAMHGAHQSTKRDQAEHAKNVREHTKAYGELREMVKSLGEGGAGDAIVGLTRGFGTVGIAIGAIVAGLSKANELASKLAKSSVDLEHLSRQAGMTAIAYQKQVDAQVRLGLSKEAAEQSTAGGGKFIHQLRDPGRGGQNAIRELLDDNQSFYFNIAKPLLAQKNLSDEEFQKRLTRRILGSKDRVDLKEKELSAFHLDPGLATSSVAEYDDAQREAEASITDQQRKAGLAKDLRDKTNTNLREQLQNRTAGWIARGMKLSDEADSAMYKFELDPMPKLKKMFPPMWGGGGEGGASFSDRFGAIEGQKNLKEGVKSGTKEGLEEFYNSLKAGGFDKPGDGTFTRQAYHPDGGGGVAQAVKALHSGGGYNVIDDDAKPKYTAMGRRVLNLDGNGDEVPAGKGPAPGGIGKNKQQVAGIMADEWRSAGMTDDGIAGIMGNVREESNFNPTLRHPDQPHFGGEAHFAHGLYQEGGTEWNHYDAWLKKNYPGSDWRDPRLQSRFAAENLKKNYPGVWNRLKNARSRAEAAQAYASGYLKPAAAYLANRNAGFARHGVPPLEAFTGPRLEQSHHDALRAHFGHPHQQKLKGDAHVSINLSGFPKGTHTSTKHSGLFTSLRLNRGMAMQSGNKEI